MLPRGPNSTFEIPEDDRSSGQHTAAEVSPYRVLMFDNGFLRPEGSQYSRALELELDRRNGTARKVWEFRANPDNYARIISAARRLSNGNTLVHFGTSTGVALSSGPIELFEVDPAGQVVWHLVAEGPRTIYRATPLSDINGETIVADQ